jgi:hypothetical protein
LDEPKQFLDVDNFQRQEKSNFEFSAEGVRELVTKIKESNQRMRLPTADQINPDHVIFPKDDMIESLKSVIDKRENDLKNA